MPRPLAIIETHSVQYHAPVCHFLNDQLGSLPSERVPVTDGLRGVGGVNPGRFR